MTHESHELKIRLNEQVQQSMDHIFSQDFLPSPGSEKNGILDLETETEFDEGITLERLNIESESGLTSDDGNYGSCDRWKYEVDMVKEANIEVNFGFFCLDADIENYMKSGDQVVKKASYTRNNPLMGSFLKNLKVQKIEKVEKSVGKKAKIEVPNHIQAPYRKQSTNDTLNEPDIHKFTLGSVTKIPNYSKKSSPKSPNSFKKSTSKQSKSSNYSFQIVNLDKSCSSNSSARVKNPKKIKPFIPKIQLTPNSKTKKRKIRISPKKQIKPKNKHYKQLKHTCGKEQTLSKGSKKSKTRKMARKRSKQSLNSQNSHNSSGSNFRHLKFKNQSPVQNRSQKFNSSMELKPSKHNIPIRKLNFNRSMMSSSPNRSKDSKFSKTRKVKIRQKSRQNNKNEEKSRSHLRSRKMLNDSNNYSTRYNKSRIQKERTKQQEIELKVSSKYFFKQFFNF